MVLKMYIGRLFIDKVALDYSEMETVDERQNYQERLANDMFLYNYKKISLIEEEPVFFVDNVQSKMNEL